MCIACTGTPSRSSPLTDEEEDEVMYYCFLCM